MHLEKCNMKVVSRLSSYVCMGHVEDESLNVKQEPIDVDDNQTSSAVCIPQLSSSSTASVTRKEEGSLPIKRSDKIVMINNVLPRKLFLVLGLKLIGMH